MRQVSIYRIDVRLCEIFKTLVYSAQEKWYLRFEPKIFEFRAPMLCHFHRDFTESELIARCICDTRLKKKKFNEIPAFHSFPQ